jgi:single-strand DNA-binding protein
MNNVSLVGRLTRDPEIKISASGSSYARFAIAVDRRKKDDGADFINIIAFGKTSEFIEKYFRKGQRIGIAGRIQTGSYDGKDGKKVYTFDVIADNVEFVESKSASGPASAIPANADGFVNVPDDLEDDGLPFN